LKKAVRTIAPIANATDPDLGPFKRRGGKMIQYAGWADSAVALANGLNYYRKVASVMGDIHDFYRVFVVPGAAASVPLTMAIDRGAPPMRIGSVSARC
jgi:hypothetical protein